MNGAFINLSGNASAQPELRHTKSGLAVTTFSVAVQSRKRDSETGEWRDDATTWYRVTAFRELAEHCAASVRKGTRVVVTGQLVAHPWESDGRQGLSLDVTADSVGLDLAFATGSAARVSREDTPEPVK